MKELKERILNEGRAINEDILKVDSFINHQVDPALMTSVGKEFVKCRTARAERLRVEQLPPLQHHEYCEKHSQFFCRHSSHPFEIVEESKHQTK